MYIGARGRDKKGKCQGSVVDEEEGLEHLQPEERWTGGTGDLP